MMKLRTGPACEFVRPLIVATMLVAPADARLARAADPAPRPKQQADDSDEKAKSVVKVYPVGDLLMVQNDYPFRSGMPTSASFDGSAARSRLLSSGVGGGFGGASGGGKGGGGMFSVNAQTEPPAILRQFGGGGTAAANPQGQPSASAPGPPASISLASKFLDLLENTIHTDDGGQALSSGQNLNLFGTRLVIVAPPTVQAQVAEFLGALRSSGAAAQSVTINAYWLVLDPRQEIAATADRATAAAGTRGDHSLSAKQLQQMMAGGLAFHGRLTCLNGQTVHLSTGKRRAINTGALPTVGVGAVGVQPVTSTLNVGAVLQVTPSVSNDGKSAIVDLHSIVTQGGAPIDPIKVSAQAFAASTHEKAEGPSTSTIITIDRPNIAAQEWSTTVSIPVGVPVVVGSASVVGPDDKGQLAGGGASDLTLVIEVRAN